MASAILDLVNRALLLVGQRRLASLAEDSDNCREVNAIYPTLRTTMIGSYPWRFATSTAEELVRAQVVVDPGPPIVYEDIQPVNWSYAYSVPSGSLKIIWIGAEGTLEDDAPASTEGVPPSSYPWEIEGPYILTDVETPTVKYIKDVTDSTLWPAEFDEAFVLNLASHLSMLFTDRTPLASRYRDEYLKALREAKAADANQGRTTIPTWTSYIADARK